MYNALVQDHVSAHSVNIDEYRSAAVCSLSALCGLLSCKLDLKVKILICYSKLVVYSNNRLVWIDIHLC